MTAFIAALSFFAALLAQANSLACEQCKNVGDKESCTGPISDCPEGSIKCVQGLENNTHGDDTILTAFKSCFTPGTLEMLCSSSEHFLESSHLSIRINAVCGMNNDPFEVPPLNITPNGYQCPVCYLEGTIDECISDKKMNCTGKQTECFDLRALGHRAGKNNKLYSFKGCITEKSCALINHLPGSQASDIATTCTPATLI